MLTGDDAVRAVAEAGRRTIARRDLARHPAFAEVSPEVGVLDEDALDRALQHDPDLALSLLADMTGATDERLRDLARRVAARVFVDVARRGPRPTRGAGRLTTRPASVAEGEIDLDRSLDAVHLARGSGAAVRPEDLVVTAWERPTTAWCLLVDRSGSMGGERLSIAAVAASAVLLRAPDDTSVIAFGKEAVVIRSQVAPRPCESVVDDLLRLRGHGVTDVDLALRVGAGELRHSRADRRITLLISDCRATSGPGPAGAAAACEGLIILAPADDTADAEALAHRTGARWAGVGSASEIPGRLSDLVDGW